jgi:anti-anti-sigma regulatory factor
LPDRQQPRPSTGRAPETARVLAGALVVVVDGRMDATRLRVLVGWVRGLLAAGRATHIECDVAGLAPADIEVVDALARLALIARRHGTRVCVRDPSPELRELLDLAGLGRVLPVCRPVGAEGVDGADEPP